MLQRPFISTRKVKLPLVFLITILIAITAGLYIYKVQLEQSQAIKISQIQHAQLKALTEVAAVEIMPEWGAEMQLRLEGARDQRRQARIAKVEDYFQRYGSKLGGYGHIFVDQSEACGGDYRILVGIAGSESGLGRVMYKKYNPFGYLNKVQYGSLEEALTRLSCQISRQHIAPCGDDLTCLGRRYAGPKDDLQHFINKVRWFARNVT